MLQRIEDTALTHIVTFDQSTGKLSCSCNEEVGFGVVDRHIYRVLVQNPSLQSLVKIDKLPILVQEYYSKATSSLCRLILPYTHVNLLRRNDDIKAFSIKRLWKSKSTTATTESALPVQSAPGGSEHLASLNGTPRSTQPNATPRVLGSAIRPGNQPGYGQLQKVSDRLNAMVCDRNYSGWLTPAMTLHVFEALTTCASGDQATFEELKKYINNFKIVAPPQQRSQANLVQNLTPEQKKP